jgi:hypothetical protein
LLALPDLSLALLTGVLLLVVAAWVLTAVLPSLYRRVRLLHFRATRGRKLPLGDRPLIEEALGSGDDRRLEELALALPEGPGKQALLRLVFQRYLRCDRAAAWSLLFTLSAAKRAPFIRPRRLSRLLEKDVRRAVRQGELERATQYASFLGRSLSGREIRLTLRKALKAGDLDTAQAARSRLNRIGSRGR